MAWSTAMAGMNWLLAVWSSFSRTGWVHVVPLSSEYWNMMSMLSLSFFTSWVQTA